MATDTATKTRRPNARHRDIVLGAIKENVLMYEKINDRDAACLVAERIEELGDELKRATARTTEDNGGAE